MANLETLELTISGNAASAKSGIDSLITSLTSLGTVVSTAATNMARLNLQLSRMQTLSKKMPNIGNMTGGKGAAGAAKGPVLNTKQALDYINNSKKSELTFDKAQGATAEFVTKAGNGQMTQKQLASEALSIRKTTEQYEKLKEAEEAAENPVKDNVSTFAKLKQSFSNVTKGASDFFGKVKRIATTMLIRSAIRGLIKDMKEGVSNLYEWSKLNNGEFAQSLDTLKSKSQQLKNSIGASIAPVISAAIPVLNSLANAAISAFNWVNQLISLLTGKSYWTKATEQVNDYSDAVSNAGGSASDWIASFDELNVMTSSSGGGSASDTSSQYEDMFENIYAFESEIRDIVDFIKKNMESIKAIAVAIGVAIAAWKLSQAFSETLPLLSKIAGLIGVGAVIAITLQANWMLTNEYLNTGKEGWLVASILTTAIGSVAAGVIAQKVFGGQAAKYTIGFTLVMSALTDIIANVKNTNVDAFSKESLLVTLKSALSAGLGVGVLVSTIPGVGLGLAVGIGAAAALFTFAVGIGIKLITQKDNVKWGNISLTESQIKEYVQSQMFESPIRIKIEQFSVILNKKADLEKKVQQNLEQIETDFNMIKLGIDSETSYTNIKNAISGEDGTGGLVKDITDLCDVNISLLKLNFSSIQMYDGQGNAMSSDALLSGMAGWNNIKQEMETNGKELTELLMQGAEGQLTPEMEEYTQKLLEEVLNMSSKIANAKEFGTATAEFKQKALSAFTKNSFTGIIDAFKEYSSTYEETIRKSLTEQIASWYALADLTDDPELKAEYTRIADELTAGFEQTVQEELNKQTSPGADMIKEWLFGQHQGGTVSTSWTDEYLKQWIHDGIEETVNQILLEGGFDQQELDVMSLVGITGWDFFSDDLKKRFLENVTIDSTTISKLKAVGVPASDIVKTVNWDSFTIEQKLEFLNSIKSAFGSSEALAAAKKAGINVGNLVDEGMKSKDEKIRSQAKAWDKIINDELKKEHPISVKENTESTQKTCKSIKDTVEAITATVSKIGARFKDGEMKGLVDEVEKQKPNVKATADVKVNVNTDVDVDVDADAVKEDIEGIDATITPTISIDKTSIKNAIHSAVASGINGVSAYINGVSIPIEAKALGGLVESGHLFIANENGNAEMIGKFGTHAAVANQEQMVEAMARGVQYAQAEQNNLLREQNSLLRGILAKEGTVRLGASSALGRIAKQSIDMYSMATGV